MSLLDTNHEWVATTRKPGDGPAVEGDPRPFSGPRAFFAAVRRIDVLLLLAIVTLTVMGLWLLLGAVQGSPGVAASAERQVTWLGIALCALSMTLLLDYTWLRRLAFIAYAGNIGLLVAVLLFGTTVNGATSWFRFGPIGFQPAETMKLCVVMVMAQWFAQRPEGIRSWRELFMPLFWCGLPAALVLLQPDLGTASLFGIIFWVVVLWAGIRARIAVTLLAGGVALVASAIPFLKEYQKERLLVFLDPSRDPLDSGYNLIQSLIAVGSGGGTGRGWGEGSQAVLRYLPEAHTDFIFAASVEQIGFLGALMLLGLYGVVFWRLLAIVRTARDRFGGYLVIGLGAILAGHVFLNIGMTIGLFPITGLPLPFMSYGGSFLVAMYVLVGLALNVGMRRFVFGAGS